MFAEEHQRIPAGLDEIPPGIVLAAFLSRIEINRLSEYDRVVVLRAHQRMASHHQAQALAAMAAVADTMGEVFAGDPVVEREAASAEIRAALTLTRRAADAELELALSVRDRLPRVWELLVGGDVDVRRARVLVDETAHLPEESARDVVDRIAGEAHRLTTGQLRARLRRLCIDADPCEARVRYESSVERRRIVVEPTPDGTAHLMGLDLAPDRVMAVTRHIDRLARRLRHRGEVRTIDQLRADVFLDLLDGTSRSGRGGRGTVELRVDVTTLAGLSEAAGELGGYGPVIADIARRVAAHHTDSEWRYVVTDRATGRIRAGITRRRPTAAQRRMVETANSTCVFPGCRMPATTCDLDHRIPYAQGGPTRAQNMAPCCRHDHVMVRHRIGWHYRRLATGDHEWTSRLGHTYTTSGTPP